MHDALVRAPVAAATELSKELVEVAKKVRVLSELSWPAATLERFVTDYAAGRASLPAPPMVNAAEVRGHLDALTRIAKRCDRQDPLAQFVATTALSYADAASLLLDAGTAAFGRRSIEVYGAPRDPIPGAEMSHLDAALSLLERTADLTAAIDDDEHAYCLTAQHVKEKLDHAIHGFFGPGVVDVVIDDELASKAAASANRIRIRGRTCFSDADIDQLLHHEAFVHSATALNGRAQTVLSALGLGAPRTTATQEGLATLAELMVGAIDLSRLRRIALRTVAVDMALEGADFLEVFKFFLAHGQTTEESSRSAMRIFRGGDVRGRSAFTKDVVYLHGLVAVHTFFRRAIAEGRPELIERSFVGRLALTDVLALEEAFDDGRIARPRHVPSWARMTSRLAASLSTSLVLGRIDLQATCLEDIAHPISRSPSAPAGGGA